MKILPSHRITAHLIDVILEAKQTLVLVSPYVNFTTYSKQVSSALVAARNRNVKIDFFIRDEPTNQQSKDQVASLGLTPRLVPNLHAKFYFNESTGIITSLNLLSSSIGNSIEIGCQLETAAELEDLQRFVQQFLVPNETGATTARPVIQPVVEAPHPPAALTQPAASGESRQPFGQLLADFLDVKIDRYTSVDEQNDGSLTIKAVGNTFNLFVELPGNRLVLSAIVSNFEANRFRDKRRNHFSSSDYDYQVYRGGKGYYDTIRGLRKQRVPDSNLNKMPLLEQNQLLADVVQFILAIRSYKAECNVN